MDFFGTESGTIVTFDGEDEILVDGKRIAVVPAWKYA
jgi:predicted AAA+ superfamily ATPase